MRFRPFLIVFLLVSSALAAGTSAMYILNTEENNTELQDDSANSKLKHKLVSYFDQAVRKSKNEVRLEGVGDPPPQQESFLTGLARTTANPEKIFGVMIDLATGARPHFTGLEQAQLILEMPAEGGIPRIMAVFSTDKLPAEIGPVRSARHYFVDIAENILGGFVHAGGSPQAYALLANTKMANIDENLNTMHRDHQLYAPHNLFLDTSLIVEDVKGPTLTAPLFHFQNDNLAGGLPAEQATVKFSTNSHLVNWEYNSEMGCYQRKQLYEKADICMENVAVLITPVWLIPDDPKNRLDMVITGSGEAFLLRDGTLHEAEWTRTEDGFFTFFDSEANVIPFKPGKTILQVIDSKERFSFSEPE